MTTEQSLLDLEALVYAGELKTAKDAEQESLSKYQNAKQLELTRTRAVMQAQHKQLKSFKVALSQTACIAPNVNVDKGGAGGS